MRLTNYEAIQAICSNNEKGLAILIDPDKFDNQTANAFLKTIPQKTTHLFVGGSTVVNGATEKTIQSLKAFTQLPIFIFPGSYLQLSNRADAVLFLSLVSGRNPEYLIGQQVKAVQKLKDPTLEVIPTGYLLIDGGHESAVSKVTSTTAMPQSNVTEIVDTAKAAQLMGALLIYLEAGSGAKYRISDDIIRQVKQEINIPLLVGGGIKTEQEKERVYKAGADIVVMGTAFEK